MIWGGIASFWLKLPSSFSKPEIKQDSNIVIFFCLLGLRLSKYHVNPAAVLYTESASDDNQTMMSTDDFMLQYVFGSKSQMN